MPGSLAVRRRTAPTHSYGLRSMACLPGLQDSGVESYTTASAFAPAAHPAKRIKLIVGERSRQVEREYLFALEQAVIRKDEEEYQLANFKQILLLINVNERRIGGRIVFGGRDDLIGGVKEEVKQEEIKAGDVEQQEIKQEDVNHIDIKPEDVKQEDI